MRTSNQHSSIDHLKRLYLINCDDAKFYKKNSFFRRRILFKVFFERLALQKESFCAALKILILDRIETDDPYIKLIQNKAKNSNTLFFNIYKKEFLQECKKRETIALNEYNRLLEETHDEKLKNSLEPHLEEIQLILKEMRIMGMDKYLI